MEHLTLDTLARLVDEAPTESERTHLAECTLCSGELRGLRETTVALGELPDLRPPRGDWQVLEARLVSEGLVRHESRFRSGLATTPGWMRAAAAVLIFASGTGLGLSFGPSSTGPAAGSATTDGMYAVVQNPGTVEEAAEAMRQAELAFVNSLVRYRQMVDGQGGDADLADPQRRYAALEYFLAAGEAAVREAPADPFMNGLLASVRAERQAARAAALRQASQTQDWY
ncbi:MAG: hypothetical protein HKN71_08960 [Gemmatimonadetes bacterium]|nr:hypothetical protein [Gemmatimonadota bacterium]